MAKHGGGMTWQPITYDPELNLIYVTTGNPQPVVAFKNREGANLFTASIVALNADTGKMVWYFQSSPHDTHDWDATQTAVLFDAVINGQPRKLMAQASRNGKFFVLDRTNGKAIVSTDFVKTNWASGFDKRGQPVPNPAKRPQIAGALVDAESGRRHQLVFACASIPTPACSTSTPIAGSASGTSTTRATTRWGGAAPTAAATPSRRKLKAIDYKTGKIRWSMPRYGPNSGLLTTAGNVVFGAGVWRPAGVSTRPRASRSGIPASAGSPTVRSPTSSTACNTSSPRRETDWRPSS